MTRYCGMVRPSYTVLGNIGNGMDFLVGASVEDVTSVLHIVMKLFPPIAWLST